MPELPDTGTFAAASGHITPDHVAEEVSLGPSPEAHLDAIREYIDAGFDHLILTQIGPEQDPFFGFFDASCAILFCHRLRRTRVAALPSYAP